MTRTSRNKFRSGSSRSRFSNQQMIKPAYSSQIHKMKRKPSGKKAHNYQPLSPKKTQYVLNLERQVAQLQRRLTAVEEKLESNTPERPSGSRTQWLHESRERRSRRTEEETVSRRSSKRKRRTAEDSDNSEGMAFSIQYLTRAINNVSRSPSS